MTTLKPGDHRGHPGYHRDPLEEIHRRQEPRCPVCPECGGPLQRCQRSRRRIIEDLPEGIQTEVTEHTIWRDYCPRCQKDVEPVVPDSLSKAIFGHRLVCFTAWLHYGVGVTIVHIVAIVGHHLHTVVSAGALIGQVQRLGEILSAWYEQIGQEAKHSATLHADENLVPIRDGKWHRLALAWGGTDRIPRVDGMEVARDQQPGIIVPYRGFGIGAGSVPNTLWSGLIDDL